MKLHTVAKFALGLVLAGLVMEGSLRLIRATPLWRVLPVVPPLLGEPDPETGYVLTPNATGIWVRENRAPIRINSLGMRDSEMSTEKPAGTVRVALTGDSIIEAVQVEQRLTFDAIAERNMAARGLNIEIANLAMSGHGPLRQLVRLRRREPILKPDMALSFIKVSDFLTNELFDDSKNPAYVPDGKGGLKEGTAFKQRFTVRHMASPSFRSVFWTLQNVELARIAYWLYKHASIKTRAEQVATGDADNPERTDLDKKCRRDALKAQKRLWLERKPREHWRRTEKFLDDYAQWASGRKIPVMIALSLPYPAPSSQCETEREMRKPIVNKAMGEFSRRGFLPVDFDLLLARRMNRPGAPRKIRGFRYHGSGHLNTSGHPIYADIIVEELTEFMNSGNMKKPGG